MSIIVQGIKLGLDEEQLQLKENVARKIEVPVSSIISTKYIRKSIDARKKSDIHFNCTVEVSLSKEYEKEALKKYPAAPIYFEEEYAQGSAELRGRPVVIGAGPCGLFAALELARKGYKPIVIERGKMVEQRIKDVETFWNTGSLDCNSNVLFGEGGAGTFSDGKLTTRTKDPRSFHVLKDLVAFGASAEIEILAKPHIGTDALREIVANIRREIIKYGGEFWFETKLESIEISNGALKSITVTGAQNCTFDTSACILAIGHSARDTFSMLYKSGVDMIAKSFAVGVRIEHLQSAIDRAQYGKFAGHPKLGAAEYSLSYDDNGRGVYSFCMCPGGFVVASSSEEGGVVVNGMSYNARDGVNANSAIVVQVSPTDFGESVLDGIAFQRDLEQKAYTQGQGGFIAPCQTVGDFLAKKASVRALTIKPTYKPDIRYTNMWDVLPSWCASSIAKAISNFGKSVSGFDCADAILTGVETRTSSPVRIIRDATGNSTTVIGLYPAGEGAGYAGGIVSASVDGLRAARAIIEKYKILS